VSARLAGIYRPGAPLRLAGAAPQSDGDGPWCVLDGVIDDRRELAAQLDRPAEEPAERLLALGYRRWGSGLLQRLRGDFALLLWDPVRGEGLLARDQLGVGCVYLYEQGGVVRFAGELRELLELLPSTPAPDGVSVAHWLAASARPGAHTLYEGVRRLEPGTMLLLGREGAREEVYWRPRFREPQPLTPPAAAARVRGALELAVTRRLDPGRRTGVLMSGGLDSASVAALAAAQGTATVRAYAGVFPHHEQVDESRLIGELRARLRLGGLDARVRAGGLLSSASAFAQAHRVPLLGWSDGWTLPLLQGAAGEGVEVTLGGDGGDELFGPRAQLLADALRSGHPLRARALARELPGAGERPPRRALARVLGRYAFMDGLPGTLAHAAWRARARRAAPPWLLAPARGALIDSDDPHAWMAMDGPRWWSNVAHGLTKGIEQRGIFEHQRLRATAAGLRARHPLLDLDLLELVLSLPPELSFDRERDRPLLRQALRGLLPETVRMRAGKAWFDSLVIDSLAGADAGPLRALLCERGAELAAYVDMERVSSMVCDGPPPHGTARFQWMHLTWRLLSAECWLRALAGRPTPPAGRAKPALVRRRA
jgi:asparagine synthase (glutamine-hydrolysing)